MNMLLQPGSSAKALPLAQIERGFALSNVSVEYVERGVEGTYRLCVEYDAFASTSTILTSRDETAARRRRLLFSANESLGKILCLRDAYKDTIDNYEPYTTVAASARHDADNDSSDEERNITIASDDDERDEDEKPASSQTAASGSKRRKSKMKGKTGPKHEEMNVVSVLAKSGLGKSSEETFENEDEEEEQHDKSARKSGDAENDREMKDQQRKKDKLLGLVAGNASLGPTSSLPKGDKNLTSATNRSNAIDDVKAPLLVSSANAKKPTLGAVKRSQDQDDKRSESKKRVQFKDKKDVVTFFSGAPDLEGDETATQVKLLDDEDDEGNGHDGRDPATKKLKLSSREQSEEKPATSRGVAKKTGVSASAFRDANGRFSSRSSKNNEQKSMPMKAVKKEKEVEQEPGSDESPSLEDDDEDLFAGSKSATTTKSALKDTSSIKKSSKEKAPAKAKAKALSAVPLLKLPNKNKESLLEEDDVSGQEKGVGNHDKNASRGLLGEKSQSLQNVAGEGSAKTTPRDEGSTRTPRDTGDGSKRTKPRPRKKITQNSAGKPVDVDADRIFRALMYITPLLRVVARIRKAQDDDKPSKSVEHEKEEDEDVELPNVARAREWLVADLAFDMQRRCRWIDTTTPANDEGSMFLKSLIEDDLRSSSRSNYGKIGAQPASAGAKESFARNATPRHSSKRILEPGLYPDYAFRGDVLESCPLTCLHVLPDSHPVGQCTACSFTTPMQKRCQFYEIAIGEPSRDHLRLCFICGRVFAKARLQEKPRDETYTNDVPGDRRFLPTVAERASALRKIMANRGKYARISKRGIETPVSRKYLHVSIADHFGEARKVKKKLQSLEQLFPHHRSQNHTPGEPADDRVDQEVATDTKMNKKAGLTPSARAQKLERIQELFVQEVEIMNMIQHENIVRIRESFLDEEADPSEWYFFAEYGGRSLLGLLHEIPADELVVFGAQFQSACFYLWEQHIWHLDHKLDNCAITDDVGGRTFSDGRTLKVLDFGNARHITPEFLANPPALRDVLFTPPFYCEEFHSELYKVDNFESSESGEDFTANEAASATAISRKQETVDIVKILRLQEAHLAAIVMKFLGSARPEQGVEYGRDTTFLNVYATQFDQTNYRQVKAAVGFLVKKEEFEKRVLSEVASLFAASGASSSKKSPKSSTTKMCAKK
ncbi:unnamed protein product [Amoebophrya sp. A120]|nr:unnamed protein product [Amoebophrya sp. A120]|eukprot:GSA120T00001707001.1